MLVSPKFARGRSSHLCGVLSSPMGRVDSSLDPISRPLRRYFNLMHQYVRFSRVTYETRRDRGETGELVGAALYFILAGVCVLFLVFYQLGEFGPYSLREKWQRSGGACSRGVALCYLSTSRPLPPLNLPP